MVGNVTTPQDIHLTALKQARCWPRVGAQHTHKLIDSLCKTKKTPLTVPKEWKDETEFYSMAQENVGVADAAGGPLKSCTDEINAATAMGQDTNDQATAGGIGPTSTFRCVSVADEMVRKSTTFTVIHVVRDLKSSAKAGYRWCGVVAR